MRVLLADSNDVHLMVHQQYLRRHGLEVFTANDGLECLAELREHRPDVLVLDPDLLWGGGDGVLDRMTSEPDIPLAAVIVLVSTHAPEQLDKIAEFPIHELKFKPLSSLDLFRSILKLGSASKWNLGQTARIDNATQTTKLSIKS